MENVDTNWNLEKKISANSNSTTVWTALEKMNLQMEYISDK